MNIAKLLVVVSQVWMSEWGHIAAALFVSALLFIPVCGLTLRRKLYGWLYVLASASVGAALAVDKGLDALKTWWTAPLGPPLDIHTFTAGLQAVSPEQYNLMWWVFIAGGLLLMLAGVGALVSIAVGIWRLAALYDQAEWE